MASPAITATDRAPFVLVDWGLFVGLSLLWGSSFLFIAIGLESLHPGVITWMRVGLGALALSAVPQARKRIEPEDRGALVRLSIVWVGIPFTLFPLAEQHINSALTGLLNGAMPIFAGILGGLFFSRPTRGPQRWGLLVGFIGVALISAGGIQGAGGTEAVGVIMVLAATFFYGLSVHLAGPLQQRYGSVPLMARMLGLATIWTAPFGIYGLADSSIAPGPVLAVAVLGVAGTGLAFAIAGTLIGRVGGTRSSFITYLIPVVALLLGVIFLSDEVEMLALAGVVLVLGGALLAGRREA